MCFMYKVRKKRNGGGRGGEGKINAREEENKKHGRGGRRNGTQVKSKEEKKQRSQYLIFCVFLIFEGEVG